MATTRSYLNFDEHQFQNRKRLPVAAWTEGYRTDPISTRLDFGDYAKGHTETHAMPGACRKNPPPLWVRNKAKLALVVTCAMEARAGVRRPGNGTLHERLAIAVQRFNDVVRPQLVKVITGLCGEYVELKKSGGSAERRTLLEIEIEGIDTILRVQDWPGLLARTCYLYWLTGMDSPGVAEALSIKPPHVRQLLSRMNAIAAKEFNPDYVRPQPRKRVYPNRPTRFCRVCGKQLAGKGRRCYCDTGCAMQAAAARRSSSASTGCCPVCGSTVVRSGFRYCSSACRKRVAGERRRQRRTG